MASLESLQARAIAARGTVQQVGTDAPVAIRLRYVGTGAVTSVTVTTATNIVTVSTEGTKTYAFSSYATVSALVGAINGDGIFQAKVLDALLSDATASVFVTGAITAGADSNGVVSWDVKADTSAAKQLTAALTGNRDWDTTFKVRNGAHRVNAQEVKYYATLGAAGANLFNIYLRRNGVTETTIYSAGSVSATATTINWAGGNGKISGNDGDEIIVRLADGTSIADAAANYLYVAGTIE